MDETNSDTVHLMATTRKYVEVHGGYDGFLKHIAEHFNSRVSSRDQLLSKMREHSGREEVDERNFEREAKHFNDYLKNLLDGEVMIDTVQQLDQSYYWYRQWAFALLDLYTTGDVTEGDLKQLIGSIEVDVDSGKH